MRLIGMLDSPYVRRVAISLAMMEIPFEHEPLSVFRDFEAFRAINPAVKVPTLVTDDGVTLMDSTLILVHLERFGAPKRRLSPLRAAEDARCQHLVGLALAACEKSVQIVYEHHLRPEEKRHQPWLDRIILQMGSAFDALEAELPAGGLWLFDDAPSQAEISAAVAWTFTRRVCPVQLPAGAHPRLDALTARAEALPAFLAWPFTA